MRTWHIGAFTLRYNTNKIIGALPPSPPLSRVVMVVAGSYITDTSTAEVMTVAGLNFIEAIVVPSEGDFPET